jgi:hypothetical protein
VGGSDLTAKAADALWRNQLGELLTLSDAAAALGVGVAAVEEMIARRELLALPAGNGVLLPAFQFVGDVPVRGLAAILRELTPVVATTFTIASWFTGPQPELEGATPAAWLRDERDPQQAVLAARRTAALLAQ